MSNVANGRGRIPGSTCQWTKPQSIVDGTMNRQSSTATGRLTGSDAGVIRAVAPRNVNTLIFDAETLIGFFRSVAFARATAESIRTRWIPYKDSKVLNIIYGLFPWKGEPGTVEVVIENETFLNHKVEQYLAGYLDTFLALVAESPAKATGYLAAQENIRKNCLQDIQAVYENAQAITKDLLAETRFGIQKLAGIKMTSTIIVKSLGLVTAGAAPFLTGLGYDVAIKVIEEWNQAGQAELVGVAVKKAGEESGKKIIEEVAERGKKNLLGQQQQIDQSVAIVEKRVGKLQEMLAQNLSKKERNRLAKQLGEKSGQMASQRFSSLQSGMAAGILGTVKYVFFLNDVVDAINDFTKDATK